MDKLLITIFLCFLSANFSYGEELRTNALHIKDAPDWVSKGRLEDIVAHIQPVLEWDIRRIEVYFYKNQKDFEKLHGLGPTVLAFSRKSDNTVHVGPKVDNTNFDSVFTHELVHIISFQKYKDAIPKWLEEGLANYLSNRGTVDYAWLAKHDMPSDVRDLTHPFNGSDDHIRYHYMASRALTEMIASKCDLTTLLSLSVGRKMENYLSTYCHISDVTAEFKKWVASHNPSKKS